MAGCVADHEVSWTSDGRVLKRYRHDPGDPPHREWRALRLLHEHAPGLAPEPVAADFKADPPCITMSALPGRALGGRPLSSLETGAIATALHELHTCVPASVLADVPVSFDPLGALGRIRNGLAAQPRPNDSLVAHACDEGLRWLSGSEANRLLSEEPHRAVFGRADHNLTNFLRDGDRVLLVDFEHAGRSDRGAEMAELVEHISARCTPEHVWQRFLDDMEWSRVERRRLRTIRRLLATMWLSMLLPGQPGARRNPPGTPRMQAERTLRLLS